MLNVSNPGLNDFSGLVDDATKTFLGVFENGVTIYTNVASRVAGIKILNSTLANPKATVVEVEDPAKKNLLSGIKLDKNSAVIIGVIAILAVSVIFSRGK